MRLLNHETKLPVPHSSCSHGLFSKVENMCLHPLNPTLRSLFANQLFASRGREESAIVCYLWEMSSLISPVHQGKITLISSDWLQNILDLYQKQYIVSIWPDLHFFTGFILQMRMNEAQAEVWMILSAVKSSQGVISLPVTLTQIYQRFQVWLPTLS